MAHWMMWAAAAGAVVILELFSGTFYLLMIAIGIAMGALAAWLGATQGVQFMVAALVGVTATVVLNRSRLGKPTGIDAARDPNLNFDIGQTIPIDRWDLHADGKATARATYRGAQWDIDYVGSGVPLAGTFRISEIQGSRLRVVLQPASSDITRR